MGFWGGGAHPKPWVPFLGPPPSFLGSPPTPLTLSSPQAFVCDLLDKIRGMQKLNTPQKK